MTRKNKILEIFAAKAANFNRLDKPFNVVSSVGDIASYKLDLTEASYFNSIAELKCVCMSFLENSEATTLQTQFLWSVASVVDESQVSGIVKPTSFSVSSFDSYYQAFFTVVISFVLAFMNY